MDDQRITVLATKRDVEFLRTEILFELGKLDSARHTCVSDPSADFAESLRKLNIRASILIGAIWILAIWLNVAVYIEGERIIAGRQAVAAAVQAGSAPPAATLNSGNERQ